MFYTRSQLQNLQTGVGVRAPARLSIAISASSSTTSGTAEGEQPADAPTTGDHSVHPLLVTPTLLADMQPVYPLQTPSFLRATLEHVFQDPDCIFWNNVGNTYVISSPISRPTLDGMLAPLNVVMNINSRQTQITWVPEIPLSPVEPALVAAFLIGNTVNSRSVQNALSGPLRFTDAGVPVVLGEALRCTPTRYDNTAIYAKI